MVARERVALVFKYDDIPDLDPMSSVVSLSSAIEMPPLIRAMCHAPIDPDLAPKALFRSIGDLGAFPKAPKAPASSFRNKLLSWRIAQEMPRAHSASC